MRLLILLGTLISGCGGSPQVYKECQEEIIPGLWEDQGNLRDKLIQEYGEDPGGGLVFYVCEDFWVQGLCLGCREKYVYKPVALRAARHEASHCYHERLFGGDYDPYHSDGEFWAVVE